MTNAEKLTSRRLRLELRAIGDMFAAQLARARQSLKDYQRGKEAP